MCFENAATSVAISFFLFSFFVLSLFSVAYALQYPLEQP